MLADVERALVAARAEALHPAGTGSPSAVGSPCRCFVGWPVSSALDKSIASGSVDVSVFSRPGMSKNTTRYPLQWQQLFVTPPTLTATVTDRTVTVGGAGGVAQLAGLQLGGVPYVYAAAAADTPATTAAGLAALVSGATVSGATITLPGDRTVIARTAGYATMAEEVRASGRKSK